jgi:signal transduction histidine kinase
LSIVNVAREAVQTTRALGEKAGIVIEESYAPAIPELPLDEVKMRQVLVNLLVNAIKFSPSGARVKLRVSSSEGELIAEVTDQGPGVPPEETVHIFELFGQGVGAHLAHTGGLGIGLHLVRRITELHGGHVGVDSRPGQGSTFWVRLPLALAALPGTPDGQARAAA